MIDWLFTNALAALALSAIAGALIWTFRPSPAVRHALWLVVLLKLVSPTGLVVSVPLPVEPAVAIDSDVVATTKTLDDPVIVEEKHFTICVDPLPGEDPEDALARVGLRDADVILDDGADPAIDPCPPMADPAPAAVEMQREEAAVPFNYQPYLLGLWAIGAVAISWRQMRDTVRFARFTATAKPAGDQLVAEVAVVANRIGVRVPAVRVLTGLASPVMWCLWRPVLLWPAGLECRLKGEGRRAVLAHELAHLRRRDHWVRRLEMVAGILHWWNPLFWLARKKLRADAELACDAWATGQADRRAYAEALLEVCSFNPRRRPAPAVGVIGEGRRAMQERLTMIMKDQVPTRLAFGAKLVVALMVIAAVPAWTLGQGKPVAQGEPPADKQVEELAAQIKALAAKLEELKAAKQADASRVKATEALKKARESQADKYKEVEKARALYAQALTGQNKTSATKVITSGEGGYKVIGPDGKEVKDAKVIIGGGSATFVKPGQGGTSKVPMVVEVPGQEGRRVKVATDANLAAKPLTVQGAWYGKAGEGQSVSLSRATYKLNREQAQALGTLLGSIKATVMEAKVDGDSVTVTTTPDVQAAIGQIVRLVSGQSAGASRYEYRVTPTKPTAPTKPTPPTGTRKPALSIEAVPADVFKNIEIELKNLDVLKDLKVNPATIAELEKLKDIKINKADLEKLKADIDVIRVEQLKNLDKLKTDLKIDLSKLKDVEKIEVEKFEKLKDLQKRKAAEVEKSGQESQKAKELEAAIKALIDASQSKPAKPGTDKPAK